MDARERVGRAGRAARAFARGPSAWLTVLVLSTVALAGCLGLAADDGSAAGADASGGADDALPVPKVPDYDFTTVVEDPHVHALPGLHTGGHGLRLVGYTDLTEALEPGVTPGAYIEVDVEGDLVAVASRGGNRGFTLADISDPAAPRAVSHVASITDTWDVRLTDGGRHLLMGMQGTSTARENMPYGLGDRAVRGIAIYDLSDPQDPVFESYTPTTSVHNLHTATIANRTVVVNNGGEIFEMVGEEGAHALKRLAQVPGSHDVHLAPHPVNGTWVLYTGAEELSIYDLSDPADPVLLGGLPDRVPAGGTAWHEQTPVPTMLHGRALLVGGGESGVGEPGPYTVFDVTDPRNASALGQWELPGSTVTRGDYIFSAHNVAVRGTLVATANYHAGVWVFDLATPERLEAPPTVAAFQPHRMDGYYPFGVSSYAPSVWGVEWTDDGLLVVPDEATGLYVLEPELTFEG